MRIYTITLDNTITAYDSRQEANRIPDVEQFGDAKKLEKLAMRWPAARLVEIWNSLPRQRPVKRFKDRHTAVGRIWTAISNVPPIDPVRNQTTAVPAAEDGSVKNHHDRVPSANAEQASAAAVADAGAQTTHLAQQPPATDQRATLPKQPGTARDGSKTAQALELMKRPGGVTLKELMSAMNWQAHSVRGFISGTLGKKMGLTVESTRRADGERVYTLTF